MTHRRRRPRGRARGPAVVTMVLALVLAACSTTGDDDATADPSSPPDTAAGTSTDEPPTDDDDPAPPGLDWVACEDGLECAELAVPVDHDDPDGDQLTLALARRPASDPASRIGSLVVNPGGPGGSGIEAISYLPVPADVARHFDIVGFDPRGVGASTPLDCRTHLQAIYDADPTMDDDADRRAFLDVSQDFVDDCADTHGDLLAHLGTVDVAHDLDRIRAALGDDGLTYLGYSYGTSIGQQYARLHPERVRALVLDGIIDVTATGLEGAAGQAEGFSEALDRFIEACDTRGCGLDGPAGDAVDDVIAAAETAPIAAPGADRPATPGVVSLALAYPLYAPVLWPQLARALDDALDGDGTGLVRLADEYLSREADGRYPNGFEVYFAVSCLDSAWPDDPDVVFDAAAEIGEDFPRVGEGLVNDYVRCVLWPEPPTPLEPVPADVEDLAPILLVSTTGDPATPHSSGLAVADQIPDAVLVTYEGDGHTIVGQGEPCIDDVVADYLVDLATPPADLVC